MAACRRPRRAGRQTRHAQGAGRGAKLPEIPTRRGSSRPRGRSTSIDLAWTTRGSFLALRLSIDPARHTAFAGDGEVTETEGAVEWVPPGTGGRLTYTFRIDHLRNARSYDARGARTWAIFRGDDLVPPARTKFEDGTRTRARIQFVMPEGWSVASPHPRVRGDEYRVANAGRAFTRPIGWFALGELGVVREDVAGTHVAIAAPIRHGFHRLDVLALLRLALPEMNRIRGAPLDRLLVVGAGDPMWRGGLSGPGSIYLHSDRPLVTDDATSPLLHELVHTSMSARADDSFDWIVEGMAEYFSMDLLRAFAHDLDAPPRPRARRDQRSAAARCAASVRDRRPDGRRHRPRRHDPAARARRAPPAGDRRQGEPRPTGRPARVSRPSRLARPLPRALRRSSPARTSDRLLRALRAARAVSGRRAALPRGAGRRTVAPESAC